MSHARFRFFRRAIYKQKKTYGHKKARLLRSLVEIALSIAPPLQRGKFGKLLSSIHEVLQKAKDANQESYFPTVSILTLIVNHIRNSQSEFKYKTSKYQTSNRKRREELHIESVKDYITLINSDCANHHHFPRMLIAILYRYKQLIGGLGIFDLAENEFDLYFAKVSFEKVNYKAILESTVQDSIFANNSPSGKNVLPPFLCGMSEYELVKRLDDIDKIPSYPNKQDDLRENFTYLLWHEMDMSLCVEYCTAAMAHPVCAFMKTSIEEYQTVCNEIWSAEKIITEVQINLENLINLPAEQKTNLLNKMFSDLYKKSNKLSPIQLKPDRIFNRLSHLKKQTEETLSSYKQDIKKLYLSLRGGAQKLRELLLNINEKLNTLNTLHDIESAERMILNHDPQDLDHVLGRLYPSTLSNLSSYFVNQDIVDRINLILDHKREASRSIRLNC